MRRAIPGRLPRVSARCRAARATSEDEVDPLIGVVLADAYRVLRLIGQGGMGRVYEAPTRVSVAGAFAIRSCTRGARAQGRAGHAVSSEAETACVAAHPNVVQVYDVAETETGLPFIVAELLDGEDLGQRLAKLKKLDLETRCRSCASCARSLRRACPGWCIENLKPDNSVSSVPYDQR